MSFFAALFSICDGVAKRENGGKNKRATRAEAAADMSAVRGQQSAESGGDQGRVKPMAEEQLAKTSSHAYGGTENGAEQRGGRQRGGEQRS